MIRSRAVFALIDVRFVVFSSLAFLLGFGFVSGFLSANALLVARMGPAQLFEVYLISGLFLLPLWGLLYILVDRFPRFKIFTITYLLFALCTVGCWYILRSDPKQFWIYLSIRVFFYAVYFLTLSQFWILAGQFFNYYETKRRYPQLVIFDMLGELAAGLLMGRFASTFGTVNFILLWPIVLILSVGFVSLLKKQAVTPRAIEHEHQLRTATQPLSSTTKAFGLVLFLFWFMYSIFCNGTDYLFNAIARNSLHTEDKLASFLGLVSSVASAVIILYQLLFSRPFIHRFGLIGSVTAMVLVMALSLASFQFFPNLFTIALAQSVIYFFLDFVGVSRLNMALSVFEEDQRGRIKIFTEGVGRSAGCIVLFLLSRWVGTEIQPFFQFLFITSIVLALTYPFLFRYCFTEHLIDSLRSLKIPLLANVIQALADRHHKKAVGPLIKLLNQTESIEIKQDILLALGRIRSQEAFYEIVKLFTTNNEKIRMAAIKAIVQYNNYEAILTLLKLIKYNAKISVDERINSSLFLTQLVGPKVLPYLVEALLDPEPRIRANAIEAIGIIHNRETIPILIPFLQDESSRIKANTSVALYSFRSTHNQAKKVLDELLKSEDAKVRRSALYAIGILQTRDYRTMLIDIISSEVEEDRTILFAAFALGRMRDHRFLEPFLGALAIPTSVLAKEALRLLERLPRYSIFLLLEHSSQLTFEEQEIIRGVIHETLPKISFIEEIVQR